MSSELTDFFKKKQEEDKTKKVDWNKEKSDWLNTINEFDKKVINWLDDPIKENFLKYDTKPITINEYLMGDYEAPLLVIVSGKDEVSFKPVGKLVLGANGRIDMESYKGKYILLYLKDKGWVVFNRLPNLKYEELTKDLFSELLKAMF